jgi:hypothetical protein
LSSLFAAIYTVNGAEIRLTVVLPDDFSYTFNSRLRRQVMRYRPFYSNSSLTIKRWTAARDDGGLFGRRLSVPPPKRCQRQM